MPTVTLFPFIYLIGWLLARPLLLFQNPIINVDLSLIGTCLTFICFLFVLPTWIKFRWNNFNSWRALGLVSICKRKSIIYFFRGFLLSILLIFIVLIMIFLNSSDWIEGFSFIRFPYLLNSLSLGCGVGIAEELIFRGWLLGEVTLLLGPRYAIFIQSLIFSISHLRFTLSGTEMLFLFIGLFLLGIVFSLRRVLDNGSLWGCIGLHGGLVGLWFAINEGGLIRFSKQAPSWLIGPGAPAINPIGGCIGILSLGIMIFIQRKAFIRVGRFLVSTVKASSN